MIEGRPHVVDLIKNGEIVYIINTTEGKQAIADSFSIRTFLHYALTERTPDHSTLSVIRQRLPREVYRDVFALVLKALKRHKLLKGNRLAIDASVLEAIRD